MKKLKQKKPFLWAVIYGIILTSFTGFVLLKTFVLPDTVVTQVKNAGVYEESTTAANDDSTDSDSDSSSSAKNTSAKKSSSNAEITDTSYKDDNIQISITTKREYDTTIYIADVQVSSVSYLKTALANNAYGRNLTATTSSMASEHNAILAINGDYYGFRDYGFVARNGVLYRSNYGDSDDEAFVIYKDGNCKIVTESQTDAQSLMDDGAMQILSFGPGLIKDGSISVSENQEVGRATASNPRTAIGMISPLHYVIVVSDGRTSESSGLSLYQLAQVMSDAGCTQAYNLDGGGSSTLWFNGNIINNPVGGRGSSEREVSDIVYIG